MTDPDAIVVGGGPNGLTAAATLARRGWRVLVLEAQNRVGGALYTVENTLPGFHHDVGAAFFPFSQFSPAFRDLQIDSAGIQWLNAKYESTHPAPDGSYAGIARNVDVAADTMGVDGDAWRRMMRWLDRMQPERLVAALMSPLLHFGPVRRLGTRNMVRLALSGMRSTAAFSKQHFQSEAVRRIVPALALHVDLGPHDFAGAGLGLVLALMAAGSGFRFPMSGAKAITDALVHRLHEAGGVVQLNSRVRKIVVRKWRAEAVVTESGEEIRATKAIVADVGPHALFLRMLAPRYVSGWIRWGIKRFRYGWGTFKMDWALSGPVPWSCEQAAESAVVHTGDSIADMTRFTKQVRRGELPHHPYLVIGQQSLVDSSRAPDGGHVLWAYSRVPSQLAGGWTKWKDVFADRVDRRIEQLAPGFMDRILARATHTPDDLEGMNENLVGGDLGGGSACFRQQLFFRPAFPMFRYRTPVKSLYLASASAHPGAGVHGGCGFNAALAAHHDFR